MFCEKVLLELIKRIKNPGKRPMLGNNINDSLKDLYIKRKKYYNEAHVKLRTDLMNFDEVSCKIMKKTK